MKYYIWSGTELLGSVKEINPKTAKQKAKLVARLSGHSHWTLSTSYIPNTLVIDSGSTRKIEIAKISKLQLISNILNMRMGKM